MNSQAPLRLREDYAITVETTSILGGRNLMIALGSDEKPEAPQRDVYRGTPPKDLLTDATELVSGLRKSLIEDGTVDNLRAASEELRTIARRVSAGEVSVFSGSMVYPPVSGHLGTTAPLYHAMTVERPTIRGEQRRSQT